jgi:glucose-6-phosphate dehydrogenase assembly protein OpcA
MGQTISPTGGSPGGTIAPEKILRELADMWTAMSKDATGDDDSALRACTMTLVTLAEEREDFSALGETIAALMPEHPARTIVVRLQGAGDRALSERVYSQCWKPFGQKRHVCCEMVDITATDAALGDLPSVILPLVVADLPVIVWCRSFRVAMLAAFADIAGMANRVIVDAEHLRTLPPESGWTHEAGPVVALDLITKLATKDTAVADLSWTRLTRWRSVLSQIFANKQNLAELPRVSKVTLKVNGMPQAGAWYFAAWVMDALTDAGVLPEFSVEPVEEAPANEMHSLELAASGWSAELSRYGERLIVTVGGIAQCNPLGAPADHRLMQEELRITGRDKTFERALSTARGLAAAYTGVEHLPAEHPAGERTEVKS